MSLKSFRIAARSRDGWFQFWTVAVILLAGTLVAAVMAFTQKEKGPLEHPMFVAARRLAELHGVNKRSETVRLLESVRAMKRLFADHEMSFHELKRAMPDLLPSLIPMGELESGRTPHLRPEERAVMEDYSSAVMEGSNAEKTAKIYAAAAAMPDSGLLASMQGDLLRMEGKYQEALAAYERGAADAETGQDSMRRALELCRFREWQDKAAALYARPGWRDAVLEDRPEIRRAAYETTLFTSDWRGLFYLLTLGVLERLESLEWGVLALVGGIVWFLTLHAGGGVPLRRLWLGLAAVLLGLFSIPVTHFFEMLQVKWAGPPAGDGLSDFFYCISGIGLREELAKLLCFLPLLLFLRKSSPQVALVTASCTGLGFAAFENIHYFNADMAAAYPRFVTANFIHIALTGACGFALWQAIRNPARHLQHFTTVFVAAVLFHGLWDWSPEDERMAGDFQFVKLVGLILAAYYYFGELSRYAVARPGAPSPAWIFLAGSAVLVAGNMVIASSLMGFRLGFAGAMQSALSMFVISAAMYYQLRRS
jgi:protease PrsW